MDDLTQVLLKGGPVALIIAVGFASKYAIGGYLTWRAERRNEDPAPLTMNDAATTNALLLDALRAERAENEKKDQRIDQLEGENQILKDQLFEQKADYEGQLGELRRKIQEITLQLDALQARITLPE